MGAVPRCTNEFVLAILRAIHDCGLLGWLRVQNAFCRHGQALWLELVSSVEHSCVKPGQGALLLDGALLFVRPVECCNHYHSTNMVARGNADGSHEHGRFLDSADRLLLLGL